MFDIKQELNVWRFLTHFWGILAASFFLVDFFKLWDLSEALSSLTLIYISILSLFATTKEWHRWKDKSFISNHSGELFIVIWTGLLLVFLALTAYNPEKYSIPGEFNATYLGILAVFALSRKSRYLRNKKNNMLYLGADHAGFQLKEKIKKYLETNNIKFQDLGNHKLVKTDDYPDFAKLVATAVSRNKTHQGILICGSGQGMCTTANKFKKIRASFGHSVQAAKDARTDGDSNVLCLSGKNLNKRKAIKITNTWLNTPFSNLPRHKRRLEKITKSS